MTRKTAFEPYDHFVLRAPLLPLSKLEAIPTNPDELGAFALEQWQDPIVRQGIQLASPDLARQLQAAYDEPTGVKSNIRLLLAFLRYLTRFASRPTPFGLFAGFSTGRVGDTTAISLAEMENHEVHARLDMEWLMRISRLILADQSIRACLLFRPNSSLYRVGARWHFVETLFPARPGSGKSYEVVSVDDHEALSLLIDHCREGRTPGELRGLLAGEGWPPDEVGPFIDELIDSQVLVSELDPVLCGQEYMDYLTGLLNRKSPESLYSRILDQTLTLLNSIRKPTSLLDGIESVKALLGGFSIPFSEANLVQVDMSLKCNELILGQPLANQLLMGARILKALAADTLPDPMEGFREAFRRRFGDREVPLPIVLDPETGIGLDGGADQYWTDPAPWVEELTPGTPRQRAAKIINPGNQWLFRRFLNSGRSGSHYIDLTPSDLLELDLNRLPWPSQITVMAELFGDQGTEGVGWHLILASSGNPSYLLGRFAFTGQVETGEWISQMCCDEAGEDTGPIQAEVVHLPEDRTGNILQRPSVTEYEIPYLAHSLKPATCQLPLTDLLVSLSGNRVVLRSIKLNREVRPTVTNAYNHQISKLAVYRFLLRVRQQEDKRAWWPDWGEALVGAPFVPGIRYQNLVLSAPVWSFSPSVLKDWIGKGAAPLDLGAINAWRESLGMPQEVVWISGDQDLYINWKNINLILAAWEVFRHLRTVRVRPFFFQFGSPVDGNGAAHANQFILCFRQSR
ncbi:MAG: lantibiotic dehydratase family protein [Bacteroidales bacterium]